MGALPNTNTQSVLRIHYQPALRQKLNKNDLTLSNDSNIEFVINTISEKGKPRHREVNLLDQGHRLIEVRLQSLAMLISALLPQSPASLLGKENYRKLCTWNVGPT